MVLSNPGDQEVEIIDRADREGSREKITGENDEQRNEHTRPWLQELTAEERAKFDTFLVSLGDVDSAEEARRRDEWIRRKPQEQQQERRRQAAQNALPELIKKWRWDLADPRAESPLDPEEGDCPRAFLLTRFRPDKIVWTGQVHDSGERHAGRWKTVNKPIARRANREEGCTGRAWEGSFKC